MATLALVSPAVNELNNLVFLDVSACVLYVSKAHTFQPTVRSHISVCRSKYPSLSVEQRSLEEIHQKHRLAPAPVRLSDEAPSQMQAAASELFRRAYEMRASDIHIRVADSGLTQVLFRIHNDLRPIVQQSAEWGALLCSAIYVAMSDISDATYERQSRQDGRISARDKIPKGLDGIRIATTPQVDGSVMVLRLLYNDANKSTDICELGYSESNRDLIGLMKRRPTGMNIIAGPTGSGKSTTLQRTLLSIHKDCVGTKHIITVEDPVEYPMAGIVQTPVANAQTEAERSAAFQSAIKAAMRLDPNIIMVGEMRDLPTAKVSVQAAMTGHQVWTTVHANDVFAIVDRMIDLGIPANIMTDASIITGLICQRLLKVLCNTCKVSLASVLEKLSEDDRNRIMSSSVDMSAAYVCGPGCPSCKNSGISGRTCAAEVVVPDLTMMRLLRKGEREEAITYWRSGGGITMLESAIEKINAGLCDPFQAEHEVGALNSSHHSETSL